MFRAVCRSSSGAPTVFAASGLHTHLVTARSQVCVGTGLDYGRSPHAYVNQRLQIQLGLLMMSDIPLETCWAFNELWNNKFRYQVASLWLLLLNCVTKSDGPCKIVIKITKYDQLLVRHKSGSTEDHDRSWCKGSLAPTICHSFSKTKFFFFCMLGRWLASWHSKRVFGLSHWCGWGLRAAGTWPRNEAIHPKKNRNLDIPSLPPTSEYLGKYHPKGSVL